MSLTGERASRLLPFLHLLALPGQHLRRRLHLSDVSRRFKTVHRNLSNRNFPDLNSNHCTALTNWCRNQNPVELCYPGGPCAGKSRVITGGGNSRLGSDLTAISFRFRARHVGPLRPLIPPWHPVHHCDFLQTKNDKRVQNAIKDKLNKVLKEKYTTQMATRLTEYITNRHRRGRRSPRRNIV